VERKIAEAEQRSDALASRRKLLDRVLLDRDHDLARHRPAAERALADEGAEAFVEVVQDALRASVHADELGGALAAVYRPESRELLVEYELPRQDVIPQVRSYRYVKARDVFQPEPAKAADTKADYAQLVAKLVLRTIAEVLDATPSAVVTGVTLNAYVSTKDRATGQPIRPCLISVAAERAQFTQLVLDEPELDPVLCLRQFFNAIVSPHPYDLEAIRPVLEFDLSRYKFIQEVGVVAGLDSRPNLLDLKPVEFEHLVRELFEAIGMKSWVTQSSKDDGVDAVAVNEDPIVGGLCIIQAKRYKNIVGVESVNALAGVMEYKRAAKGVLVTTSWVGKASRDFAAHNGRIEIIEGRQLKSMLKEHLGLDVLIGLPKLPVGWAPDDII
jgi:restriction system protein